MKKEWNFYFLCASIYAMQSLSGLPGLSLFFYLKESLGLTEEKVMTIGFYISLAWIIKPLFGTIIDNSFTNKVWIIISLIGSILASLLFSITPFLTIPIIIAIGSFNSVCAAFRDISIDGMSCVLGKENNNNHINQSIQWGSLFVASIFTGLIGGWLADNVNYKIAYLCTIPLYFVVIYICSKLKSNKKSITCDSCFGFETCLQVNKKEFQDLIYSCHMPRNMWQTIESYISIVKNKTFLLIGLFLFLYNFSPSFATPLQYRIRDSFKWSGIQMGILDAICSIAALIGMILFVKFIHKINTKKVLFWSIFWGASTTLAYLYFTPLTAYIYGICFGFVGIIIQLVLLTWAAKISINGKEATSFALLCGIMNGAASASLWAGKTLLPLVGLNWLIIIAALASFICLPLLKFIDEK
jgi:MFS family permease